MSFADDLEVDVKKILRDPWSITDGRVVPDTDRLVLGNQGIRLECTVLYADLAASTTLVEDHSETFAAEVYKCYLHCASKIIRKYDGTITAFDGDRVMAVYVGDSKNTNAVKTALGINWAVREIINKAIPKQYSSKSYRVEQAVGVATGKLLVAKTGIRGSNDLVWVGPAANIAAKLCSLRYGTYATWITPEVYKPMHADVTYSEGNNMWDVHCWEDRDFDLVYKSHYLRRP